MKKKMIILSIVIVIAISIGFAGYMLLTPRKRCDEETLKELRGKYPIVRESIANASSAMNIPLSARISHSENYLEISFIEPVESLAISNGTDKFGDSMGYFNLCGWKVKVESVVRGDSSLKGKEIIVRMNSAFESNGVSRSVPMLCGVSKREEGDYWYSYAGAFYNVDGYVLSVVEEFPGENYSGMSVRQFKKEVKNMKVSETEQ